MPAHHDHEIIDQAREFYVQDNRSITWIADHLDIPRRTVNHWKLDQEWLKLRNEHQNPIEDLDEELGQLKRLILRWALSLDKEKIGENLDLKTISVFCRVIGALSPPSTVQLRRYEKDETEARKSTVEERMARLRDMLGVAGFTVHDESDSDETAPDSLLSTSNSPIIDGY
jgi:hypothetical protein